MYKRIFLLDKIWYITQIFYYIKTIYGKCNSFLRNISDYVSQKKHKIQIENQNELIDDILRKISKTGMESLTENEKSQEEV